MLFDFHKSMSTSITIPVQIKSSNYSIEKKSAIQYTFNTQPSNWIGRNVFCVCQNRQPDSINQKLKINYLFMKSADHIFITSLLIIMFFLFCFSRTRTRTAGGRLELDYGHWVHATLLRLSAYPAAVSVHSPAIATHQRCSAHSILNNWK